MSAARGHRKPEVESSFDSSTSFLFMFNTHYVCKMHGLKAVPNFLAFDYGGMWISTARERRKPNIKLPFVSLTMVLYLC
jgi:hypothetical protein